MESCLVERVIVSVVDKNFDGDPICFMLKDKITQSKSNSESLLTELNNLPRKSIRWLTSLYLTSALARRKATPDVNLSVRTFTVIPVHQSSGGGFTSENVQVIPTPPTEMTDFLDKSETLQVPTAEYPVNLVMNQIYPEEDVSPLDDAMSPSSSKFILGMKTNGPNQSSLCMEGLDKPCTVSSCSIETENFVETLCLKQEDSIEDISFDLSVSCTTQGESNIDIPMNVPGEVSTENLFHAVRHDHLSYVESGEVNTFQIESSDSETPATTTQTAEICSSNSVCLEDLPLPPTLHPINLVKNQLHNEEILSLDDGCSVSAGNRATEARKTKSVLKKESNVNCKKSLLLKCHLCSIQCCKRSNLLRHIRKIHMATGVATCSGCQMELKSPATFHLHQLIHLGLRPFPCKSCPKTFINESSLKSHQKVHRSEKKVDDQHNPVTHLICNACNVFFISAQDRKEHSAVHTGVTPYACKKCPKAFKGKKRLKKHEASHTGETPFVCEVCSREFTGKKNLTAHKPFHSGRKAFMCGICGASFLTFQSIVPHQRLHTGERPFSCNVCNKTFRGIASLRLHRRSHSQSDLRLPCDTCDKTFRSRQGLHKHQLFHSGKKPHVCEFCSKAFTMKYDLERHRKHHTGDKKFKCDLCDRAYVNSSELKKHVRKTHTKDYPMGPSIQQRRICDICGKSYPTLTSFTQHLKSHSGEKDHLCSFCGKAFVALSYMRKHEKMHTS